MSSITRTITVTRKGMQHQIQIVEGTSLLPISIIVSDYDILSGSAAVAYNRQPNGTLVNQACTISENTISFTPPEGFYLKGYNKTQVRVTNNNRNLFSFVIDVWCDENITDDADVEEINSQPTLVTQLLSQIGVLTARIDAFTALPEGSTTSDAALNDIRIGYDGTEYPTPGEAVREQVNALSNELKDVSQKAAGWTDSAKMALVTLIRDTAYVKNTEISDTYNTLLNELGVVPIVHATSVSLDKNNIIFDKISNTQRIVATIIPRDTTDAISWVSSNDKVATVDQKGTVTSVGEGNCEITLKVGSIVATCSVNVSVGEVYYITNELKNVSTDNNSELILKNNSYNATLTAYEGAGAISEVSVLMGGNDITGSAYSAGEISISSVTGNIVIKAKADDDYEMGYLNDMGVIQSSKTDVLSSVYTPVKKGSDIWIETYAQKETVKTFRINEYDAELNFIRRQLFPAGNAGFIQKFTVSDTTEYIRTGFGVNQTASDFIDALFDGYDIYALGNIINSLDDVSYTTGGLDNDGAEVEDSNRIRSAYIPVNNNAVCFGVIVNPYTFENSAIRVYDSSKEFLSSVKLRSFSENSKVVSSVANANYIRLLIITNGLDIQEDVIVYVNEKFYRLIKG